MRIENTVFISYRRRNISWALMVSRDLAAHGYDVFVDVTGLANGDFERAILQNIRARAHFLVLLTPSALDGCHRPDDWLRREIEAALEAERNIIPLLLDGFDFNGAGVSKKLTGLLSALQRYNAHKVPAEYFDEAMERLRRKWLNVPLAADLEPVAFDVEQVTQREQHAAIFGSPELLEQMQKIAEAPLFSDEQQAFRETLPVEEQVIMELEAKRQRESLMTSILNNIRNMKRY